MDRRAASPERRVRFARRARAAVLWSLAAFALSHLGLLAATETAYPEFRDPLYGRKKHELERCLAEAPPGARVVLLLGSSRIYNGADSRLLREQLRAALGEGAVVYNFGMAGAGPVTELLVLSRLLADGIKPDLVLIEVFPAMLAAADPLLEWDALRASRLWHGDLALLERCDASFAAKRSEWLRCVLSAWHAYRYGIVGRISTRWVPPQYSGAHTGFDRYGWQPLTDKIAPPECRATGLLTAQRVYSPMLADFRPGPGARALTEMLNTCRRERLSAVMLLMPEGDRFTSWYSPQAARAVDELVGATAREASVPVIDARRWMHEDDFFDSHHLLPASAQRFSYRLGRRAAGPLREQVLAALPALPRR